MSTSASDPEIIEIREGFNIFRKVIRPGTYLVDTIPWLKYIPWYAQELRREFERSLRLHTNRLDRIGQQMVCIALPIFRVCSNRCAAD
jgi:hypothetical protein